MDFRVILYHKQATSARTRFVLFAGDTVFAFGPTAPLSQVQQAQGGNTVMHPAAIMQRTEEMIGLPAQSLKTEAEFQHSVEVPGGTVQILLAAITTIDPPFDAVEQAGGKFIDLTEARGLPPVELEMLRHAYEVVLGG